jgi:hypothetical protein
MVAPGGWRLKDHFEKGEARRALHEEHWDFVVLQEQSTLGSNVSIDGLPRIVSDEVFRPCAEKWAAEVAAAGAKPVFYLTWAREKSPEDQAFLTSAVRRAASATHSMVAPVGPAWVLARDERPALSSTSPTAPIPRPPAATSPRARSTRPCSARVPSGCRPASGTPVNLDTEELETGKTAVLVDLAQEDARVLQEAAWSAVQALERLPAEPDRRPARFELPPLPDGAPLTELSLAGAWRGPFAFSPTGPADLTLYLDPPAADGAGWSGHVELGFHSKDLPDVSLDLTRPERRAEGKLVLGAEGAVRDGRPLRRGPARARRADRLRRGEPRGGRGHATPRELDAAQDRLKTGRIPPDAARGEGHARTATGRRSSAERRTASITQRVSSPPRTPASTIRPTSARARTDRRSSRTHGNRRPACRPAFYAVVRSGRSSAGV